jgi:hypothetical protein
MVAGSVIAERFRLEALAGTGGMGAVYRATDLQTGGAAAVKLLHPHAFTEAARLAREAEALALLSHPAIVRYLAHGSLDQGLPYLAMGVARGRRPARPPRSRAAVDRRVALAGQARRGRARRRSSQRLGAPRHQADQPVPRGRPRRSGQGPRFRRRALAQPLDHNVRTLELARAWPAPR